MIVFLTLVFVAILAVLVKVNIIKLNLWWKLSPLLWMTFLLVALFIPMQFWAPAGKAIVVQYSVPIVPNVSGQVIEVPITANVNIKKGDVLFRLDPTPFEAAREQVAAQLELANLRLTDALQLAETNSISQSRVELYQAQVKQYTAAIANADYNLAQTVVKAPADGFVTNLGLRPGTRVASFPITQAMAFVENSERVIGAQIPQSYLRFIKPGQTAELTFKLFPGKIFRAHTEFIAKATASGQVTPSGSMLAARELAAAPFMVRLKLEDDTMMNSLPAGALASVAIYSDAGKSTHIIRKVMIRMDSFLNYVIPY